MVEHRALPVIGIHDIAHDDSRMLGIDAARPLLGLGRIQDGEHLLGNRHAVHGRMEKRPQRTHGDEELRRQEHHAKRRIEGDLAVSELHHCRDDARSRAAEGEHVHHGDGVELHGEQAHRGSAEGLSLLVHLTMARLVGLIDLQGGQTLQVLKERAAKIGVGSPIPAHDALGDLLHRNDGDRDQRHANQQGDGGRQAKRRQESEHRKRCQHGIEQLRKILPEIAFQLLATLDAYLHGLACGDMLGIAGAHAHQLVIHLPANRAFRGHRRSNPHALREGQAHHAHRDDGNASARKHRNPAIDGGAVEQPLEEQADKKHKDDVRNERHPLRRHVACDIPQSLRHHRYQPFIEHGAGFLSIPKDDAASASASALIQTVEWYH